MSMSEKLISIIVVSAGNQELLQSCRNSFRQQTYKSLEIIVIDNSCNENPHKGLSEISAQEKIYVPTEKLSYCQALNKGIDISGGNFILCLNDDVILEENFIGYAIKTFENDQNIGMVSGKILRFDGKTIDSTGLFLSPFRTPKERGYGLIDRGQFDREGYIFGVNGAVALYRKEMLDQIKLAGEYFDSDFRFFYEDLDIAWRAQNLGWKGYYIPQALAYHLRGGTARQKKGINRRFARRYLTSELHFDLIKNRYLTMIKNEKISDFIVFLPFVIVYDVLVLIYILLFKQKVLTLIFLKGIPMYSAFQKRLALKKIKVKIAGLGKN